MGLFKKFKSQSSTASADPLVTYHISQNLSGKLNVTATTPDAYSYSITLAMKKTWRDTIEVAIHRSVNSTYEQQSDVVGHCLIQTATAKFTKCRFDAYGQDITLEKSGSSVNMAKANYKLSVPELGSYKWTHDHDSITEAEKRLKLVDEETGDVLARFGGAQKGVSEFGMLEVYDAKVANDQDWCGLCILTAVCVFAREERSRERKKKANGLVSTVSNWGGLLTMGIPVGP